ncbi:MULTISPECIES: FUSC family protein [Pseudomonas]|uniref:Fusaric acid resistance conserved domain protein n=1 Tax=Pseudomonas fluorescens (strain Q2-87) TaxID=1038922 RepID=J2Y5P3_PSEFQ|nr:MULTISPECIES: FUSC family protein [Pseudomonas]EJL02486.1 fusaric acid resistance conserved domain protein [Pseudomonas fluorescens Q2-87]
MTPLATRFFAAIPWPWTPATLSYVLRSILAAGLALWLGFQLHLESPFSGASTVLLLVQPIQGAVLGKGFYRMLGTLVGMVAAFVLTGLFAQQMVLFIVGIGMWLGLCVGAMSVLRHYQATAAVVAGYTVCLALGPAIVAPEQGFDHIITRGTAVALGVLSLSLVVTLFSAKTMEQKVRSSLADVWGRSARLLAARLSGEQPVALATLRHQLAMDIGKVDDQLGLARGESSLIRSRQLAIQAGLAHLQSAVLDVHGDDPDPGIDPTLLAQISTALRQLSERMVDARCDFLAAADTIGQLHSLVDDLADSNPCSRLPSERLDEQLKDLGEALLNFSSLDHARREQVRAVGYHRNFGDAARNGFRALLATLAAGAVWYLSGWDQGPALLAVMGPCCTLVAMAPAPAQGIASFIRGTLYAILAAALCKFLLMPQINGFPLLFLLLATFWSFGIHATSQPRHALQGIAYLIGFNTLVSTGGTALYDFVDFANQALAWIVAMLICLLAFQILPKDRAKHIQALKLSLHKNTLRLLRHASNIDHPKWQAKQQHRLVALKGLLGANHPDAYHAGYLSLQLSKQLNRLQRKASCIDPESPIARCAQTGARRIARYAHAPAISAAQARRTSKSMSRLGAHHLSISYQDLARLLEQYANIARPPG